MKKMIKVMIEIPDNWLEESQGEGLLALMGTIRERFADRIFDKAIEKVLKDLKIPKIKFTQQELKKAVLEKMAEKAIEEHE